jgi:hypothetical protein
MRLFCCTWCVVITLLMMGCGTSDDSESSASQTTDASGDASQSTDRSDDAAQTPDDSGPEASDAAVVLTDTDATLAADSSEGPGLDSVDDGVTSLDDGESQTSDAVAESTDAVAVSTDAATESSDVAQVVAGEFTLTQLWAMREGRGDDALVAFTAYVQGLSSEPYFTCVETTDAEGNRVLTYTYSETSMMVVIDLVPSTVRVETYDADGRFLSWAWEGGASYICAHGDDDITCIWTDKEGAACVDHFDSEGGFTETDCDTLPGQVVSCEHLMDGRIHCSSETTAMNCEDWYSAEAVFEEGQCVGAGMLEGSGLTSDCALQGDVIVCSTVGILEQCTLELDLLLNVLSRTCVAEVICYWGSEECGSTLDACTCAWRTQIRALLCDMGNMDPATQIDAPATTGLLVIELYDQTPIDGDQAEVLVNTDESWFYVRITGSGFAGPDTVGPFYYGPYEVEKPDCD